MLGLSIRSHHRPGQVSSARQSPWDSLGCRLYDFRVEFSLCSCSRNAWGPNVLGQIAQLSVLVLGSMPAPVAVRGFCVTLTGGDRRTDLARNLFQKNSRFKAIPSMLSLSIACLQMLTQEPLIIAIINNSIYGVHPRCQALLSALFAAPRWKPGTLLPQLFRWKLRFLEPSLLLGWFAPGSGGLYSSWLQCEAWPSPWNYFCCHLLGLACASLGGAVGLACGNG